MSNNDIVEIRDQCHLVSVYLELNREKKDDLKIVMHQKKLQKVPSFPPPLAAIKISQLCFFYFILNCFPRFANKKKNSF